MSAVGDGFENCISEGSKVELKREQLTKCQAHNVSAKRL